MLYIGILLVIPCLIALGYLVYGEHRITMREFGLHLGTNLVAAILLFCMMYHFNTSDVEVWNGKVRDKQQVRVSCKHSYDCNCRTVSRGSGRDRTSHRECDTCYEHSNDWDWMVYTTAGDVKISRVDRQGSSTPPRWAQAEIGEPASIPHTYRSYFKASPDTLFVTHAPSTPAFLQLVPTYPEVYDYYRIDRVLQVNGVSLPEVRRQVWEAQLRTLNAELGPGKHCNVVLILVRDLPRDYAYAVERQWLGGKKNDIVVVLGAVVGPESQTPPEELTLAWVEVLAWSKTSDLKVRLRDDLQALGKLHMPSVFAALRNNIVNHYERKPMEEFSYLKANFQPSWGQLFTAILVNVLLSVFVGYHCYHNQVV